jgi:nucleoside phosphorylase/TolA-binding protein
MTVPPALVDQIRSGQAVLVLCTGACLDATRTDLKRPPDPKALSALLANKFLASSHKDRPLAEVEDLAVSEAGLSDVQRFIADLYDRIEPSQVHDSITTFVWRAIVSTHFDLSLERAYDRAIAPLQRCVPFTRNSESVSEGLSHANSVMYLKLHGSLSHLDEPSIPLILSPDQYTSHTRHRSLLFERLEELATEHPLVVLASSPGESDLRALAQRLVANTGIRPRSYLVAGPFSASEEKLWDGRKFTPVGMSPTDFFRALNLAIEPATRRLAVHIARDSQPIRKRFAVPSERGMTDRLTAFLEQDVEFITPGHASGTYNAKEFYRGHLHDWSPIEHKLDVARSLTETLLTQTLFAHEEESRPSIFHLIKGHAGSGKTVILRRLAWDSAMEFDKLCLYARPNARLDYAPLAELANLCRQRIFLFVDQVSDHIVELRDIILQSRKDKIAITIVGTERHHAWNIRGGPLAPLVQDTSEVRYLNEKEIEALISTLDRHDSLGHLAGKPRDVQREALAKKAGRQLLVALHEATLGKPFSDIVLDEYQSISSPQARSLYLTVCVLHRLGAQTRAGLISRIHGIPLHLFREQFFAPLESIVFVRGTDANYDFSYESRHPHIAEIVFEGVLADARQRYDEYVRILNALDTGYASDESAFRSLLRSKELSKLFPDHEMVRRLYAVVRKRYPDDAAVLQQAATYEMNIEHGDLESAGDLLRQARTLAPYNKSIGHSIAELTLRRAERGRPAERSRLRNEARALLKAQLTGEASSYTYHSLLKIDLAELREMMAASETDEATLQRKIRDVEQSVSDALQRIPHDDYILSAEATFAQLINNEPRAILALKRAFGENKSSPYIAMRLAKTLAGMGMESESLNTLREYLDLAPQDKDVHFEYALALLRSHSDNQAEILYHLRQSFTRGDTRFEAQFWYARALFLSGDTEEAHHIFRDLRDVNSGGRDLPRGVVTEKRYSGSIASIENSYCYVTRDGKSDRIYSHASGWHRVPLSLLRHGQRVTFDLAFNLRGPIAIAIDVESAKMPSDVTSSPIASGSASTECDVGIIIALKEEFRELAAFVGQCVIERDVELGHHYYGFTYPFGTPDGLRCVATMIGDMGPVRAALATERFITSRKPSLLIMVGISASLHRDLLAGDVFVATQVDLFLDSGKAESDGIEPFELRPGGSVYRAPRDIVDAVRNFEFAAQAAYGVWRSKCEQNWESVGDPVTRDALRAKGFVRDIPVLEECQLASGPLVGASTAFSAWLRRRERQFKALDMEAGGAMVAASERSDPKRMVVVRGISDFGDDRKAEFDAFGQGLLRRYAMRNALDLLWTLLDSKQLEP